MQNRVVEALEILEETEDSLKMLIRKCLSDENYGDVAVVARIAEGVTALISQDGNQRAGVSPIGTKSAFPSDSAGYPRFKRSGDTLIKEGWSKRHRGVYKHRSSLAITQTVVEIMVARRPGEGPVKMDEVVRLALARDSEIKRYQVTTSFGWLKAVGLIRGSGRSGYRVDPDKFGGSGLAGFWGALPESEDS